MSIKKAASSNINQPTPKTPEQIITEHVLFSVAMGAIPVPILEIAVITAVQADMVRQLANHFKIDYDENLGKSVVTSIIGSTIGTSIGRAAASALKVIPGIGTVLGISSQAMLAGATTYAIGKIFEGHFSQKGTLIGFEFESFKKQFDELLKAGGDFVKNIHMDWKKDDVYSTLAKLKELKDAGIITEGDYEKTKKALLEKLSR